MNSAGRASIIISILEAIWMNFSGAGCHQGSCRKLLKLLLAAESHNSEYYKKPLTLAREIRYFCSSKSLSEGIALGPFLQT
jgi:hypothetical protein